VISGVYKIEVGLVYYYEQDSYSRGYVVLALTQSHELYGWGMLGLTEKDGKIVKVCYNTPVKLAEEVADMGVTKEELYLVTTDGALQCIAVADAFQDEKTFTDVTCGTVPVESVCCGDDFFVARDILGLLYCGGSNREGQLGVEDPEKTEEGQTVMPLGETRVRMAAAGAGTAYVLLPDGTMLAWGDNDYGQIGNGRRGKQHSYDEPVYLTAGVNMVFAGTRNSYYTLENGDLYAMGSGYSATPVKVFENVECVEPRDGWLLTEDHVLYSKSDGEYEPYMEGVADYESSGECHLVLKEDGSLWGWGDNESGELGIGTRSDPLSSEAEPVTEPVLIMEGVAKAAVSYYPVSEDSGNTVLILLENGDLYLCGYDLESDSYWDETTGDPSESFLLTPQKIREGVRDIYPSDGTLQSFYITDDNQLFAIGSTWDLYYDTGAWDENDEVALRDGVKMTTDDFLLDLDGTVNIFGSSTMIELFGFDEESWTEKAEAYGIGRLVCEPVLEGMKTIASSPNPSYDHYLAVTETGDLYVWGDNTYGQLGLGDAGTDENIFTVSLPS
jgi:alpha-tubulin suppressor-like RCC1 family protein